MIRLLKFFGKLRKSLEQLQRQYLFDARVEMGMIGNAKETWPKKPSFWAIATTGKNPVSCAR
jgi:hypothetical protein